MNTTGRNLVTSSLATFTLTLLICVSSFALKKYNVDDKNIGLSGYDPVSYFNTDAAKKGPLKGNAKIQFKTELATYNFSSEANKHEFIKNPAKFEPAYGGWCAFAVAKNKVKVEIDPESFLIQDGKLLLFFKGFLNNTRDKWQTTKDKTPASYLMDAEKNWPETINTEE